MSTLEKHTADLRRFFEPWATEPGGPAIWQPNELDENASFKKGLIAKAHDLLNSVGNSSHRSTAQSFDADIDSIEQYLADDHERDKFLAMILVCKNLAKSIAETTK